VNKAAIERGLFDGSKFTFYKTELEQKEELGNPDASKTNGLKSANYEKLVDGIVQKGQRIAEDDVLIGKYMPLAKGKDNEFVYTDTSIVYQESEPAIVHNVIIDRNEDDAKIAKVSLRKFRAVSVGDKFSSRSGQKGICALLMKECDLPFTESGIRPALLFNSHGIPSRMTCAQLIESLMGNVCAIKGCNMDQTMFKDNDIESISSELEQYGFNRYGYERMMSGITGEYIDTLIFFGPTFYQRLQKFVADAEYSVRHALTDAVSLQPLEGQGSKGGLKMIFVLVGKKFRLVCNSRQNIQIAGKSRCC
jgi:DNA-directed RNA polymerase II subunit RPB2